MRIRPRKLVSLHLLPLLFANISTLTQAIRHQATAKLVLRNIVTNPCSTCTNDYSGNAFTCDVTAGTRYCWKDLTLSTEKTLTGSLSLTGVSESQLTQITAKAGQYRHFQISSNGYTLSLTYLKLVGGTVVASYYPPSGYGGSILASSGKIVIHKCEFSDNSAEAGGAIAVYGSYGSNGINVEISASIFRENTARQRGGAVSFYSHNGLLGIFDTHFESNQQTPSYYYCQNAGGGGGAIHISSTGYPYHTIANTTFFDNDADCTYGHVCLFLYNLLSIPLLTLATIYRPCYAHLRL